MRLIFLGDIYANKCYQIDANLVAKELYEADLVISNLEGVISASPGNVTTKTRFLGMPIYSSLDVLDMLNTFNVGAVTLANNHMYDLLESPVSFTKRLLAERGISSFGAGVNLADACRPYNYSKGSKTVKVYAFGWDVIGCRSASLSTEGVNPLIPRYLIDTIRKLRSTDQTSFVAFIFHWNYELERYPHPAHRQLAHDLVAEGVDAIIGLHPHVVQGAELIQGKPVVYSVGNWFFPTRLSNIILEYPSIVNQELALEIENEGRQISNVRFHWHQFDAQRNRVSFEKTENWDGEILKELTPFAGMSSMEYVRWFKHNRRRRKMLPVYENYHDTWRNLVKDKWVKTRHLIIKLLLYLRVKGEIG